MSDQIPWSRHYDEANTADKLSKMELANGNEVGARYWQQIADQKRVDGDRALERQVPKGWKS